MIFEIWRPVVGYEGLYSASDLGRIRVETGQYQGKILALQIKSKKGYKIVRLSKSGKATTYSVHKIVSEAHLGIRLEGMTVNHKDGIKINNRLSNLEYMTNLENNKHAQKLGLRASFEGEKNGRAKLKKIQVIQIRTEYFEYKKTRTALSKEYNVGYNAVDRIIKGQSWKHLAEEKA